MELQSYIDELWCQYRQTAIFDDEKPEAVRRAMWARGWHYVHMRQYFADRNVGKDLGFESLSVFCQCLDQLPAALKEITSKLEGAPTECVVQHVNDAWAVFFQGLPPFAQLSDATDMKQVWFLKNCATILRAFEWPPKGCVCFCS